MNLSEYASYDGLGLADLVRRKEITPRELCQLALQAVERLNPHLNAVIETFPARADSAPPADGAFAGVPFLVKDFPIEAGVKAEMGSELAAGFTPARDSVLMQRFRQAGLINLGRTTTSEFGLAALTVSRHTGATRNPWDLARTTAGSSGGSAAAVAAGIVPLANGGDGGGSIRNPASFCGLVGLKPTRGRISLGPDTGDPYSGMVVGFALTRTVRDCAAALDAVEGPAIGDPFEIPRPVTPYLAEIAQPTGRLRIAVTTKPWSGLPIDPEVVAAVAATARLLEQMGHTVIEDAPRFDYGAFLAAQVDLWCGHTAAFIDAIAQAVGRIPSEQNLQTTSWATYVAGKALPATHLVAAEEHYNLVTRAVGQFLAGYDVLLTPTNTCLPLPFGAHELDAPGATVEDLFDHLAPIETFTALFNGTGHPALSLPLHSSAAGLPIGLQFVAGFGQEAKLFRLAAALEQARPWRDRRPAVHVSTQCAYREAIDRRPPLRDDTAMRLTAAQLEQFHRDGVLVLPSLFSPAEVAVLRAALPAVFAEDTPANFREKDGSKVRTAMGIHLRSPAYARLVRHPRFVEPARQILGDDRLYVMQAKVNVKAAFGGDVWQWHYDFATHHREDGIPNPLPLNLHVFLDDVTEFNGPLWFIRGSHRPGPAPTGLDTVTTSYALWTVPNEAVARLANEGGILSAHGPAGTGLIFGDLMVHGSPANMSPWDRRIFSLILNPVANQQTTFKRPDYQHHRDFSPVLSLADDCLLADERATA